MSKKYTEKSIESLSPLEFTRLKPGVYAGNTEYATQLLVEILSNSIDEYNIGNASQISIIIKNDIITVSDDGQGFIPNSFRDDGKSILEAAFSVLNTSGKYREDGTYEGSSLGAYGIGCKLTNYLSNWMIVKTFRDGISEEITFKEGVFSNRKVLLDKENKHGTIVQWKASKEFFTNSVVEENKVKELLQTLVCICPGLLINLDFNGEKKLYQNKNGIDDLVDFYVKKTEIIKNRLRIKEQEGKNKIDFALTYTSNYSSTIIPYVNTGLTESGPHITQIKTIITREFNKFFKNKGWLKQDNKLSGDDIQEGMFIIFNLTTPNVGYDAQVKTRVVKLEMAAFNKILTENINLWLSRNEKEIKAIFDKAMSAQKAREAAKKAKEKIRGIGTKTAKAKKFDSKLADCNSTNRAECSIVVVEGDSASGNLKMIRDRKSIAVMPVRGKILNVEKASLEEIMNNQEIITMMEAFGLEWDPQTLKAKIRNGKPRYGKIVVMSDADVDGEHIKILFYTFIFKVCPELFTGGYIYAGVPPLYKVLQGKDNYIYLRDDAALEEFRKNHIGKKYEVYRYKGLGEMSKQETTCLIDPKDRNWQQVTIKDAERCAEIVKILMGKDVESRQLFLSQHATEAQFNI